MTNTEAQATKQLANKVNNQIKLESIMISISLIIAGVLLLSFTIA